MDRRSSEFADKRVDVRGSSVLTKGIDIYLWSARGTARADKFELMYSVPVVELIPILITTNDYFCGCFVFCSYEQWRLKDEKNSI